MFAFTNFRAYCTNFFAHINVFKTVAFVALFIAAGLAGRIPVPGTPVGITMQTFVLMLAAFYLSQAEGITALGSYITLGALGLPVFSGGVSTAALIGPSAGFIWGFIPAFVISHCFIQGFAQAAQKAQIPYFAYTAALFVSLAVGSIAFLYIFGVTIQSFLTHTPWVPLMNASFIFVLGDCIKAIFAVIIAQNLKFSTK
ncbi:biotin transporter BioY [Alloscardovia venturai]|uniref:Biotin transporter n=1 Tax=Alloscardovia venturai TaxID=1769421 RepID=A0ABW2Y5M2_9BIFI